MGIFTLFNWIFHILHKLKPKILSKLYGMHPPFPLILTRMKDGGLGVDCCIHDAGKDGEDRDGGTNFFHLHFAVEFLGIFWVFWIDLQTSLSSTLVFMITGDILRVKLRLVTGRCCARAECQSPTEAAFAGLPYLCVPQSRAGESRRSRDSTLFGAGPKHMFSFWFGGGLGYSGVGRVP